MVSFYIYQSSLALFIEILFFSLMCIVIPFVKNQVLVEIWAYIVLFISSSLINVSVLFCFILLLFFFETGFPLPSSASKYMCHHHLTLLFVTLILNILYYNIYYDVFTIKFHSISLYQVRKCYY